MQFSKPFAFLVGDDVVSVDFIDPVQGIHKSFCLDLKFDQSFQAFRTMVKLFPS